MGISEWLLSLLTEKEIDNKSTPSSIVDAMSKEESTSGIYHIAKTSLSAISDNHGHVMAGNIQQKLLEQIEFSEKIKEMLSIKELRDLKEYVRGLEFEGN